MIGSSIGRLLSGRATERMITSVGYSLHTNRDSTGGPSIWPLFFHLDRDRPIFRWLGPGWREVNMQQYVQ